MDNGSGVTSIPAFRRLSDSTSVLGVRVYVLIAVGAAGLFIGGAVLLLFFLRSGWRARKNRQPVPANEGLSVIPAVTREIGEIKAEFGKKERTEIRDNENVEKVKEADLEEGKGGWKVEAAAAAGRASSAAAPAEMEDIGWGRWYSLVELEAATAGFAIGKVIGEGGYGVVYRGVLPDATVVAVKNLLNNKGQAEKEFKVEVEAIGKVRHKNLVGLVGYCAEGPQRMLVYEYIENGNLEQWLHRDVGPISPLTWDARMKIAIGTAKGIAYLHEGLEPKVVHRDIKSSNILLDKLWNAKVSDFGLAKLLGSGSSYVNTRVMGTFGYVAPEYANTGMLNEASDVYSYGVLLMEIISGRSPVDYSRTPREVNLVEWFKGMVGNRHEEEIVDPLIEVQPSARALTKVLLVCLRCIDSDFRNRPKMGQVVHMLEGDDFPFRTARGTLSRIRACPTPGNTSPFLTEKVEGACLERSMWR